MASFYLARLRVGCSIVALLTAPAAWGNCVPNPAQSNTTTTCSDSETGGLVVNTSGATVVISAGATVTAPSAQNAITVAPVGDGYYGGAATLLIDGAVDGGSASGIRLTPGSITSAYYYQSLATITVGSGGTLTGITAITSTGDPAFPGATVAIALNNSGIVTGTGGTAIAASDPANVSLSITNAASGTIGAVAGFVTALNNAGTIDGGAIGAITVPHPSAYTYYGTTLGNSGTIRSSSVAATIALDPLYIASVANTGTIANSGSGAALSSTQSLSVTNAAGATILSAGSTAIATGSTLSLTNKGAIVGDVQTAGTSFGTLIDTSGGGTITGNINLGGGNSTVVADFGSAAVPIRGVSGSITGGNNNTLTLEVARDTTIAAPLAAIADFTTIGFNVATGATLTLANGFTTPTTLNLGDQSFNSAGGGAVVINATLATVGPAISTSYYSSPSLTNNGSITATLTGYGNNVAVTPGALGLVNTGSITAIGGTAVYLSSSNSSNSGTITATGTALSAFDAEFTNSGTITSTGGIGVTASGNVGNILTNTGTISGQQAGASTSIILVNSGTVTSPTVGVLIDAYGGLDNRAGGVINGGVGGGFGGGTYAAQFTNAGTINGNVDLGISSPFTVSNNRVVAAPGGIINGSLVLGSGGDTFVTSLTNTGPGEFAGVTGTVTGGSNGGGEAIRYRVDATTSASVALPAPFTRVGYELTNGPALTLTAPAPQNAGVDLAGSGTVDLTADLNKTSSTVLNLTATPLTTGNVYAPNAITVTSHGTLVGIHDTPYRYAAPVVTIGTGSSFTNAGTISASDTVGSALAAVAGAGTVTNAGTILLDGATGISGQYGYASLTVTNSGAITQITGGGAGTGIVDAATIINSGTISTSGAAIRYDHYTNGGKLTNSGSLVSTGGPAIVGVGYSPITVTNAAGGTITGNGTAIALTTGTIDNSGTIIGDVALGCVSSSYYCFSGPSVFVARPGGTVTGNVTFGDRNDLFVAVGATTGVSGSIDGGGGVNTFARSFTTSTTIAVDSFLPMTFAHAGIGASGSATIVTVTASPNGITTAPFFFGDGQIINQANVSAAYGFDPMSYNPDGNIVRLGMATTLADLGSTLAFTNEATLADGVIGSARSFTNNGTIGTAASGQSAVALDVSGDRFDFANGGTITGPASQCHYCINGHSVTLNNAAGGAAIGTVAIGNSGTLTGPVAIHLTANDFGFDNSGAINSVTGGIGYPAINSIIIGGGSNAEANSVTFTNSGTIADRLSIFATARTLAFANNGGGSRTGRVDIYVNPRSVVDPATGIVAKADQDSASFANGGTIAGGVSLTAAATATTFTNGGTIAGSPAAGVGEALAGIATSTVGSSTATVTNRGTIVATSPAGIGLSLASTAAAPQTTTMVGGPAATITLINSGTIRSDGGGYVYSGDPASGVPDYFVPAIGLVAAAKSDGASTVTIANSAGGVISANGVATASNGGGPVTGVFAGGGSVALLAAATQVSITNAGTITGGTGSVILSFNAFLPSNSFANLPDNYLAGAIQTVGSIDTLINTAGGVITGSVDLGASDDRVENYGTIAGNVFLRDGNDTFVQSLGGTVIGTVDGGTGSNTLILDTTAGGALSQASLDHFVNFAPPILTGNGTITAAGPLTLPTLNFTGTALTVAAGTTLSTTGPVTITTGDADVAITNYATITGGIAFGNGSDTLINAGTIIGNIALGNGSDRLTNTGNLAGVTAGNGPVTVTNSGSIGAVVVGNGTGTVSNSGRIASLALGTGSDAVINTGAIAGPVSFGGSGTIGNNGTIAGPVTFTAAGAMSNGGTVAGPVSFSGDGASVFNSGTIAGAISFANGSNSLTAAGTIGGNVTFGSGDDIILVQHGAVFGGTVDGGAGSNAIAIAVAGSDTTPDELNLSRFTRFDRIRQDAGIAALTGNVTTGTLNVNAGRLIGRAGSIITATAINVAAGATFGSAGTVAGNIAVAGILSPGASPGTMTVTGSVALAAGSNSLFEFTPTVSDKLLVSGSVTIAPGAALTLTGVRPLTPGAPLDLIVAGGGISGDFTTISRSTTVLGFLRQTADRLQLFGQFASDPALSPQVARTVTYVNSVLVDSPSPALLAAVPLLLTADNSTNAAAFARLNPEAYASASRIGTENGLSLSAALRTASDEVPVRNGPFTFVQAIGEWRRLPGDAATGVNRADVSGGGVLGGIGVAHGAATLAAFGGYINASQSIADLSAQTKADGIVAGISATFGRGPLSAAVTLAYDGSDARTTRAVPGAATHGGYALHGFIADASLRYAAPVGGVVLRPEIGLTHVATMRAAVAETGSAAFALTVARRTESADFVDGALRLSATPGAFTPWVAVGVRHQFAGLDRFATAAFAGASSDFTVPGVTVRATVGSASAGFSWRLRAPLSLYGSYRGEFTGGDAGHTVSLGTRLAF